MGVIQNGFDYFGFYEIPTFVLCNPDKKPLYSMTALKDRRLTLSLNAMSTLSFVASSKINDVDVEYYDYLTSKRLVLVDGVGYFLIVQVEEDYDGIEKQKTITANSLESELIYKKLDIASGDYKLYDVLNPQNTLLGKVFKDIPNWTIGYVDLDVANKYRYFEATDTTIYNFLMTTVEEAYECIFKFNTFTKQISVYAVENAIIPSDIYLSYDNLVLSTQIRELSDELYTAMLVSGGNGLSVFTVNPMGAGYIYNFDYYMNTKWMSQGLIDAISAWKTKFNQQKVTHNQLLETYYDNSCLLNGYPDNVDDSGHYGAMVALKDEYDVLLVSQSNKIQLGEDLSTINSQISAKQSEIDSLQLTIDGLVNANEDILTQIKNIANGLSLKNTSNFTTDQYLELVPFIIETSYQNENFTQTDSMTPPKIQEQAQKLYDQSIKVLERISQPRYEFSVESLNMIFIEEFQRFTNQLELGSEIYLSLGEDKNLKPVLLKIELNYDDPSNFVMTFGNRLRLDDSEFIFADLFGKSLSTSTSVAMNSGKWNNFNENYKDTVSTFISSALDASKNAIISSIDQEFIYGSYGLRGRKLVGEGVYSDKQLWMNNSTLAFTRDGWATSALALGEIYVTEDIGGVPTPVYKGYGIAGDVIVGKLIAGNQLTISNENNTFVVDSTGVTLSASTSYVDDGGGNISSLTTYIQDNASGNTTFYSNSTVPPTGMVAGDLWYQQDTGRLYRYSGTDWQLIQDKDLVTAVEQANTTASSKIKTYFQTEPPGTLPDTNVPVLGDLWFDSNDNNKPYRYNGSGWTTARDAGLLELGKDYNKVKIETTNGITVERSTQRAKVLLNATDGIKILTAPTTAGIYDKTVVSIDTSGNATFAGVITASDLILGTTSILNALKTKITGTYLENISASTITTGTLDASTITVTNLNASNITSGTLTGRTVQTSGSGKRVLLNGTDNSVDFWNSSSVKVAKLDWINEYDSGEGSYVDKVILVSTDSSTRLGIKASSNVAISSSNGYVYISGADPSANSNDIQLKGDVVPTSNQVYALGKNNFRWQWLNTQYINSTGTYGNIVTTRAVNVDSAGNFGTTASTMRVKENIQNYEFNYDSLINLPVVTFNFKKEFSEDQSVQYGVIAETAQSLGLEEFLQYDDLGLPNYFTYERLPVALLQMVQKQDATIKSLEARIVKLELK